MTLTDSPEDLELDTVGFRLACPERTNPPGFVRTKGRNEIGVRARTRALCECDNCWNRLKGWIRSGDFEEREELERENESPLKYEKITIYDTGSNRYLSENEDGEGVEWNEDLSGNVLRFEDLERAVRFKLQHECKIGESLDFDWDRLEYKRIYLQD